MILMLDIFFNFLNFFILLAIIGYIFYHFINPEIKKEIELEKKNRQAMQDEHMIVLKEQKRIKNREEEDKHFYQKMLQKFDKWRSVFAAKKTYFQQQKKEQQLYLQEKLNNKSRYIILYQMQKKALKPALKIAETDLKEYFNNIDVQKAYINNIMQDLKI